MMGDERQLGSTDREDEVVRRIAARLRITVPYNPAFDARVMRAVRAERRVTPNRQGAARWPARLWGASALLAAVATLMFVFRGYVGSSGGVATNAAAVTPNANAQPATQIMRFRFATPAGQRVHHVTIAGSFNGWDTLVTPLHPVGGGQWVVDVPLRPGRYIYQFVLNGNRWVPDPAAPRDAGADFGSSNSVVMVAEGGVI